MTIEKYIADNSPREVVAILEANGAQRKITKDNIEEVLLRYTKAKGDVAFSQLAQIDTPYKRLILSSVPEKKSGACGCSNCSGVDGEPAAAFTPAQLTSDNDPAYIAWLAAQKVAIPPAVAAPLIPAVNNNHLMVAGVVLLGILTVAVVIRK